MDNHNSVYFVRQVYSLQYSYHGQRMLFGASVAKARGKSNYFIIFAHGQRLLYSACSNCDYSTAALLALPSPKHATPPH